jgi:hypothetical protein
MFIEKETEDIDISDSLRVIEGHTYPHKESIKDAGFVWNPEDERWEEPGYNEVPDLSKQDIENELDNMNFESLDIELDYNLTYNAIVNQIRTVLSNKVPNFFKYFDIKILKLSESDREMKYKPTIRVHWKNKKDLQRKLQRFLSSQKPSLYTTQIEDSIQIK